MQATDVTIRRALVLTFGDNSLAKDFTPALTGGGGPVSWVMTEDGSKKVLAQTSTDSTDYRFPLCILNGITAKYVEVSINFKSVSGKVDQAGGLVVRYQDKDITTSFGPMPWKTTCGCTA